MFALVEVPSERHHARLRRNRALLAGHEAPPDAPVPRVTLCICDAPDCGVRAEALPNDLDGGALEAAGRGWELGPPDATGKRSALCPAHRHGDAGSIADVAPAEHPKDEPVTGDVAMGGASVPVEHTGEVAPPEPTPNPTPEPTPTPAPEPTPAPTEPPVTGS